MNRNYRTGGDGIRSLHLRTIVLMKQFTEPTVQYCTALEAGQQREKVNENKERLLTTCVCHGSSNGLPLGTMRFII
jgi:hypothetical protein